FNASYLNTASDSLVGYVNFLWTPFEFECDKIEFDSITTAIGPCSEIASPDPFQGFIVSFITFGLAEVENTADQNQFSFTCYPNPAHSLLAVECSSPSRIELFDVLGRVIVDKMSSVEASTLDVSMLPSGSYILRAECGKIHLSKRIIIE